MYLTNKFILTTIVVIMCSLSYAQPSNFNSSSDWSMNKKEVMINIGASQFLGDLGGADAIGTDYSLRDLNWPSTLGNIGVGYRYRFHKFFATTTMLNLSMLKGDDALTKEYFRNARNLNFRSPFINLNQRIEFIFYSYERRGSRLGLKGGQKTHNLQIYALGGIGIAWFNPQGRYFGDWVNLRPLKTAGQGLEGGPKNYLPITATIPAGLGVRFAISQMWTIGVEAIYLKTFSDYIDDVSGNYYDAAVLAEKIGPTSAYMSNPSKTPSMFNAGSLRGDSDDKDAVFYLNLVFTKNVTYRNYKGQKQFRRFKYSRSKF